MIGVNAILMEEYSKNEIMKEINDGLRYLETVEAEMSLLRSQVESDKAVKVLIERQREVYVSCRKTIERVVV